MSDSVTLGKLVIWEQLDLGFTVYSPNSKYIVC